MVEQEQELLDGDDDLVAGSEDALDESLNLGPTCGPSYVVPTSFEVIELDRRGSRSTGPSYVVPTGFEVVALVVHEALA